jgi:hypothetical protein
MFIQRYFEQLPSAGEIVIFDRSWYNRAGVESVMGFSTENQVKRFLELCPQIEKYIIESGIQLILLSQKVAEFLCEGRCILRGFVFSMRGMRWIFERAPVKNGLGYI